MEYELQVKVKNARLLNVMRELGYENAAQLSRACGKSQAAIGEMLNLKQPLYKKNSKGESVDIAKPVADVAEFLGVSPEEIIPPELWIEGLEENQVRYQMSSEQAALMFSGEQSYSLEKMENEIDAKKLAEKALATLTNRERALVENRIYNNHSYRESGRLDKNQVTVERARQMMQKALKKMKRALEYEAY